MSANICINNEIQSESFVFLGILVDTSFLWLILCTLNEIKSCSEHPNACTQATTSTWLSNQAKIPKKNVIVSLALLRGIANRIDISMHVLMNIVLVCPDSRTLKAMVVWFTRFPPIEYNAINGVN